MIERLLEFMTETLTSQQKYVLLTLQNIDVSNHTFTSLVTALEQFGFSRSTLKYILKRFNKLGLLRIGDKHTKGTLCELTPLGRLVILFLSKNKVEVSL